MKKKVLLSVGLSCLAALLFTGCSSSLADTAETEAPVETQAAETQAVETTGAAELSTDFEYIALPDVDEQIAVEDLPEGAEEFITSFCWSYGENDYDCETCTDPEQVLLMLIGDYAFTDYSGYPVEQPVRYERSDLSSIDPLGHFDPVSAVWYQLYSREAVEWAAINVLNVQPEVADAFPEEGIYYYLYDDMYRVEKGDMGSEAHGTITSACRSGNRYHILFEYEQFWGENTQYLEADLEYKTADGASWWSVYSVHEQTSASAAMDAYRQTLEELSASSTGYTFTFAYLDGDDIPELIVDTGVDHARIIIFIFVNGKAVPLFESGQGTELSYVPGKNLFSISDITDDGETVTYYQISQGSLSPFCTLHSDADGYTIDQTPVSETQYNQQKAEFDTEVWIIVIFVDDGYPLTAENIIAALEQYCYTGAADQNETSEPTEVPKAEPNQQEIAAHEPFYGIWVSASKSESEMKELASDLAGRGYNAQVFVTTDWSNLNTETWYVVSAGVYSSEEEAQSALADVQANVIESAYVKYSGAWQGQ